MDFREFLRRRQLMLGRFYVNQARLGLNDDDPPLNNANWLTKQWDDGTGKFNKQQHRLGGRESWTLGYRNKKLD